MAKKVLVVAVVLLVVFVAVSTGWLLFWPPPVFSTIQSPDGTITLRLTGDPTQPTTPFVDHSVNFDMLRGGQSVLVNKPFHSGDWFDPSFDIQYPRHAWLSNSVIRFGSEDVPDAKRDTLIIQNNTDKTIAYVEIESADKFLVFDLAPGAKLKLLAYSHKSLSWIEVEGEFAGGGLIPWKGSNFIVDRSGPFEYQVLITSDGPRILSSQLREYIDAK